LSPIKKIRTDLIKSDGSHAENAERDRRASSFGRKCCRTKPGGVGVETTNPEYLKKRWKSIREREYSDKKRKFTADLAGDFVWVMGKANSPREQGDVRETRGRTIGKNNQNTRDVSQKELYYPRALCLAVRGGTKERGVCSEGGWCALGGWTYSSLCGLPSGRSLGGRLRFPPELRGASERLLPGVGISERKRDRVAGTAVEKRGGREGVAATKLLPRNLKAGRGASK